MGRRRPLDRAKRAAPRARTGRVSHPLSPGPWLGGPGIAHWTRARAADALPAGAAGVPGPSESPGPAQPGIGGARPGAPRDAEDIGPFCRPAAAASVRAMIRRRPSRFSGPHPCPSALTGLGWSCALARPAPPQPDQDVPAVSRAERRVSRWWAAGRGPFSAARARRRIGRPPPAAPGAASESEARHAFRGS